ncbi:MAG: prephenate dehydratase [Opitutales bacterium]
MNQQEIRDNIDKIDVQILDLIEERINCAKEMKRFKLKAGLNTYVPSREAFIFQRLEKINNGRLADKSLKAIYREIISASISLEEELMIGFLGPKATFTHQAALKAFGSSVQYKSIPSIPDVFTAVGLDEVNYGVIPIENSTEGAVMHSMDMLVESDLTILGQVYMEIEHCLLTQADMHDIKTVASKDQAIGQCRDWLHRYLPKVEFLHTNSTSAAVELAAQDNTVAAIASSMTSEAYGVPVLQRAIQDKKNNITRFLIIGKTHSPKTEGIVYKTSIVISIDDRPGALYDILIPFNEENINLTRIESRPNKQKAWNYYFFIDFIGHWDDENVSRAIEKLKLSLPSIKHLGSYPDVPRK